MRMYVYQLEMCNIYYKIYPIRPLTLNTLVVTQDLSTIPHIDCPIYNIYLLFFLRLDF